MTIRLNPDEISCLADILTALDGLECSHVVISLKDEGDHFACKVEIFGENSGEE